MKPQSTIAPRPVSRARGCLGSTALVVGAVLFCLGFVAEAGGDLPFFMPRSWYVNRWLWYVLAVAGIAAGVYLLRSRPRSSVAWKPSRPGLRFRRLLLYTRANCELCEEAKSILDDYRGFLPPVQEVDIEGDRELLQTFGTCVPVVEIDGKVRFRGRVDEPLLRRLIEGTPPRESKMKDER